MTTIEERVEAGAAWLEANRPGWVDRINLKTLNLGDPCKCVLGQEFGTYGVAPIACSPESTVPLGMLASAELDDALAGQWQCDVEYVELTAAWRDYITARRAA